MTEIRLLTPDDFEKLTEFLVNFESENPNRTPEFWYRRFQLWWEKNPAFSAQIPRGWCIHANNKIVGFFGLVPSEIQLNHQNRIVCNSTTWRVLPEFRDQSLSLMYHQMQTARETLLFNTTPNPVVEKILKILKFDLLPTSVEKEWVYLINPEKFLRKAARKIGNIKLEHSPLAPFLFRPGAWLLHGLQLFYLARFHWFSKAEVRQIQQADAAFDDLWERSRGQFATTNVRNAATVNWYCFENQDFAKYVFAYYKNSQVMGYIVFYPAEENSVLHCLDLWIAAPQPLKILRALLQFARKFARENTFDSIRIPCFNQILDPVLNKLVWLKTTNVAKKNYFKNGCGEKLSLNQETTYFSLAQGDVGL